LEYCLINNARFAANANYQFSIIHYFVENIPGIFLKLNFVKRVFEKSPSVWQAKFRTKRIYPSDLTDGEVVDFDNYAMDASRYASFQFSRVNSWDYD
jgi:hypothetical protein